MKEEAKSPIERRIRETVDASQPVLSQRDQALITKINQFYDGHMFGTIARNTESANYGYWERHSPLDFRQETDRSCNQYASEGLSLNMERRR
jgi:hypothetical protein